MQILLSDMQSTSLCLISGKDRAAFLRYFFIVKNTKQVLTMLLLYGLEYSYSRKSNEYGIVLSLKLIVFDMPRTGTNHAAYKSDS